MAIEVRIKKSFGDFTLDVDFTSQRGRLGILGASGSGKSMTLKGIAGIIRPDEGRIVLNDRVLFDSEKKINLKPQVRRVGYLFQNYALFPHRTVAENIASGLGIKMRSASADARVKEMLRLLQLEGMEERYPGQLSGGQQQRVALGRILVYKPEIILLDEPFSALDEHLREQLQLQLSHVLEGWKDDTILVTHSRDEAYRLTDHMMIVDGGRIVARGETKELFHYPKCVAAARLSGCKNIEKAIRRGDHEIEVPAWRACLYTSQPVPDNVTAVGVRAHDFFPASPDTRNAISVAIDSVSETPFERVYILLCPDGALLWWKMPREQFAPGCMTHIAVKPEDVMVLTD